MRKFRVAMLLIAMVLFVLFMRSVTALDADGDTIKDEFDVCPQTASPDLLPIIRNNPEFYGCGCEQIYEKLGDSLTCYDVYCVAGRTLSISERITTKEKIDCGPDYCVEQTLHDFPEPDYYQCIDGKIVEDFCKPQITSFSNLCTTGVVPQKNSMPSFEIEITEEVEEQTKEFDYFSLLLENPQIRTFLGNPDRTKFDSLVEKTANSATISRVVSRKRVGNTNFTIPYISITIKPIDGKQINKVAVIEVLDSGFNSNSFIFYGQQPVIVEPTRQFVWLFESLDEEGIIINYQINEQTESTATTIVVGETKRKSLLAEWWPLLLIPIIGYFAYVYIVSTNKD